jgi:hypothetical protein
MDEPRSDRLRSVPLSLKAAMRRARVEGAEQNQAVADLHETEIARLEILEEAIRPILSQVPDEIDMFDAGIAHGERPRLFIDMIGFVEMAHDKRGYRFVQDTRHGRRILAETDRVDRIVEAITNYIARRLVERERALASDWRSREDVEAASPETQGVGQALQPPPSVQAEGPGFVRTFFAMLGVVTFLAVIAYGAYWLWDGYGRALWTQYVGPPPF